MEESSGQRDSFESTTTISTITPYNTFYQANNADNADNVANESTVSWLKSSSKFSSLFNRTKTFGKCFPELLQENPAELIDSMFSLVGMLILVAEKGFSCSCSEEERKKGYLFVTLNYCLFHTTSLKKNPWSLKMAWRDIERISSESASIHLQYKQRIYVFTSFSSRKACYEALMKIWRFHGRKHQTVSSLPSTLIGDISSPVSRSPKSISSEVIPLKSQVITTSPVEMTSSPLLDRPDEEFSLCIFQGTMPCRASTLFSLIFGNHANGLEMCGGRVSWKKITDSTYQREIKYPVEWKLIPKTPSINSLFTETQCLSICTSSTVMGPTVTDSSVTGDEHQVRSYIKISSVPFAEKLGVNLKWVISPQASTTPNAGTTCLLLVMAEVECKKNFMVPKVTLEKALAETVRKRIREIQASALESIELLRQKKNLVKTSRKDQHRVIPPIIIKKELKPRSLLKKPWLMVVGLLLLAVMMMILCYGYWPGRRLQPQQQLGKARQQRIRMWHNEKSQIMTQIVRRLQFNLKEMQYLLKRTRKFNIWLIDEITQKLVVE